MTNILFVCSRNKWRSPTAEYIFSGLEGVATSSAGTSNDADHEICHDDIEWADVIFAMEKKHIRELKSKFSESLNKIPVHCLGIKDEYEFMDSRLITELETKFARYAALYSG